jgi:hypothetical protein
MSEAICDFRFAICDLIEKRNALRAHLRFHSFFPSVLQSLEKIATRKSKI